MLLQCGLSLGLGSKGRDRPGRPWPCSPTSPAGTGPRGARCGAALTWCGLLLPRRHGFLGPDGTATPEGKGREKGGLAGRGSGLAPRTRTGTRTLPHVGRSLQPAPGRQPRRSKVKARSCLRGVHASSAPAAAPRAGNSGPGNPAETSRETSPVPGASAGGGGRNTAVRRSRGLPQGGPDGVEAEGVCSAGQGRRRAGATAADRCAAALGTFGEEGGGRESRYGRGKRPAGWRRREPGRELPPSREERPTQPPQQQRSSAWQQQLAAKVERRGAGEAAAPLALELPPHSDHPWFQSSKG